jgi:DNA-binding MarR family transcriptional regulator
MSDKNKVLKEETEEYLQEKIEKRREWREKQTEESVKFEPIYRGFASKLKNDKMKVNPIIVYLALCEIANTYEGVIYTSNEKISEVCGIKGSTLSDSLSFLEEKGYIERFNIRNDNGKLQRKIVLLPI